AEVRGARLARRHCPGDDAYPAPEGEADARTRTGDPFITSEVLYQLSYVGGAPTVAGCRGDSGPFWRSCSSQRAAAPARKTEACAGAPACPARGPAKGARSGD